MKNIALYPYCASVKSLVRVTCAVALTVLLLGCSSSKTVVTPGGAAKVTETAKDKGTVEMTVGGEKVKGDYGLGKVPDDFPKDIPIYPSYKNVVAANVGASRAVHLFSNDVRSAISAFYEKELAAKGWKADAVERGPERDEFNATKNKLMLNVSILDKGSDRTISIMLINP